jgi:hypothetical protein
MIVAQKLPVRVAAKALGVSPSSYLRLARAQAAPAAVFSSQGVSEAAPLGA